MQAEMQRRGEIARRVLGDMMELPADPRCPHIWLPMPELAAERMAARALRAGVEVTPPSAPVVAPDLISGVRVCVGAIADHGQVESALRIIAMSMTSEVSDRVEAVV
jgi:DNA-binding transcriptional MocR family regulator